MSQTPRHSSISVVKPSFFCSSLEAFSKHSVPKKFTQLCFGPDLSQLSTTREDPEPCLTNWERWLEIHKKQQDILSAKLKRPPQCMVMNANLSSLYINQEKRLLTEASNFEFCDKYRGHPSFWKTDNSFRNDGGALGIYQTVQKKYDRSRQTSENHCPHPTVLEYVGIPDEIYKEKGLSGKPCFSTPKEKWETSYNVVKRKEDLKNKIEVFQEHTPEISNVAVVGISLERILTEPTKSNDDLFCKKLSTNYSTSSTNQDTQSIANKSYPISVLIGDEFIGRDTNLWTVYFGNCYLGENYEENIIIENLGESSLRYTWEFITPNWVDSKLPLKYIKKGMKGFYFNKNDYVILPGQKRTLAFYFQSQVAGVFCEKWAILLSCSPDEWKSVTVELQAVAENTNTRDKLCQLDSYIESCTRYTTARKTVSEILERRRPEKFQGLPYDWKFLEEQLFVYNNPDLFYDNKYVLLLKTLFQKVSEGPWDYSVKNLRCQLLKNALHKDMSKEIEMYASTVYQLMKPNTPTTLTLEKHKAVYELLCCFVNKMETECSDLKSIYNIANSHKFSGGIEILTNAGHSETTAKLSTRASHSSKKNIGKKTFSKTKSLIGKSSLLTKQSIASTVPKSQTLSIDGSILNSNYNEYEQKKKKQEFLEVLYVKTYYHLSQTIDHIAAVIDTFDILGKKTVLETLKNSEL